MWLCVLPLDVSFGQRTHIVMCNVALVYAKAVYTVKYSNWQSSSRHNARASDIKIINEMKH